MSSQNCPLFQLDKRRPGLYLRRLLIRVCERSFEEPDAGALFGDRAFAFFRSPDSAQKTQALLECSSDPAISMVFRRFSLFEARPVVVSVSPLLLIPEDHHQPAYDE